MQSHHCLSIYLAAENKWALIVNNVNYNSLSPSLLNCFVCQWDSCNPLWFTHLCQLKLKAFLQVSETKLNLKKKKMLIAFSKNIFVHDLQECDWCRKVHCLPLKYRAWPFGYSKYSTASLVKSSHILKVLRPFTSHSSLLASTINMIHSWKNNSSCQW